MIMTSTHLSSSSFSLLSLVFLLLLLLLLPFSISTTSSAPSRKLLTDLAVELPIITTGTGASTSHLIPLKLGHPPQTMYVLPDTGSKATWVYCGNSLHRQTNISSPTRNVFGSANSSTFSPIRCTSPSCTDATATADNCSSRHGLCEYKHEYMDDTWTTGYWAKETATVKSSKGVEIKLKDMMIGCSSQKHTNLTDGNGILGLSPALPSLTEHLAMELGGVFSYFISTEQQQQQQHNLLIFGKTKRFDSLRKRMQETSLLSHDDPSFFYVNVTGLFINDVRLDIPGEVWAFDGRTGTGGVILDTGTTFTYVPRKAFQAIHDVYAEFFTWYESSEISDMDVCFNSTDQEFEWARFPRLSIEFEGGSRLTPYEGSLFYDKGVGEEGEVEEGGGIKCLAVRQAFEGDGSIIGSLFQRGFFWEYDLKKQRLGFAAFDSNAGDMFA